VQEWLRSEDLGGRQLGLGTLWKRGQTAKIQKLLKLTEDLMRGILRSVVQRNGHAAADQSLRPGRNQRAVRCRRKVIRRRRCGWPRREKPAKMPSLTSELETIARDRDLPLVSLS